MTDKGANTDEIRADLQSPSVSPESIADAQAPQFVVGIGASAGGLKSIELLLADLEPNTDAAFVVITHLAPDVSSSLDEILGRSTSMAIEAIEEGTYVRPKTVYLIPPGSIVRITNDKFSLFKLDRKRATRVIDEFFVSLAHNFGKRSIGIVLSGSGVDGAEGIKAVRQAGGTTIVESFQTAQFDSMPKACVKTGCVDAVMTIPDTTQWLNRQLANPLIKPEFPGKVVATPETGIELLFSLLSNRFDLQLSRYKTGTISRRIERRQQICQLNSVTQYAEYVQRHPDELELLYDDLMIGVTKFFRDSDAFAVLKQCIDQQIQALPDGETFRAWSAGCATGEEAYSIAILIYEALERNNKPINFKVFATDIHRGMLDQGSHGVYQATSMEYVSEEYRKKYFGCDQDQFRILPKIRHHMVFAQHNVFQDPPFTKINLVTCRNLLIYLTPEAQQQALSFFHFSMVVDGMMMLGSSESLGDINSEFRSVNQNWNLFQKIRHVPSIANMNLGKGKRQLEPTTRRLINFLNNDRPKSLSFTKLLDSYDLVLGEILPAAILLDDRRNILHVFGEASKYLIGQPGRYSGNLNDFLDGQPRVAITAALLRSLKQPGLKVALKNVVFETASEKNAVNICVRSLQNETSNAHVSLIEFFPDDPTIPRESTESEQLLGVSPDSFGDLRELEAELVYTKDSLSATIEELETSNEELQAANEELVASNEELQSTNEELQSVNEELYTVNIENNRKIDELKELSGDLDVLLNDLDVATLFLDNDLNIRKFTSAVSSFFDLLPQDVGRSIANFRFRLNFPDIIEQIERVRDTGVSFFSVCENELSKKIQVRIYRHESAEKNVGIILNFVDADLISHLKVSSKYSLSADAGYWLWQDVTSDEMWWSPKCFEILGLEFDSIPQRFSSWKSLVHKDDRYLLENAGTEICPIIERGFVTLRMSGGDSEFEYFQIHAILELQQEKRSQSMTGFIVREKKS